MIDVIAPADRSTHRAALLACLALVGCGGATAASLRPADRRPVALDDAVPDPAPTLDATRDVGPVGLAGPDAGAAPAATAAGIDGVVRPAALALRTPLAVAHRRQRRRATAGRLQRGRARLPGTRRRRRDPLHVRLPGR